MPKEWQEEEGLPPNVPETNGCGARGGSPERVSDANAAGTPSDSGEAGPGASLSNTHLASSRKASQSPELDAFHQKLAEERLFSADGYSGPVDCPELFPRAVVAIDWLEESMRITWDETSDEPLFRLQELVETARDNNSPEQYELAGQLVSVHPIGIGSGRQQRLEFRLDWPGVMLAFSRKGGQDRQHANLQLKITGEACLLIGAMKCRQQAEQMIEELGGYSTDRWIRRIDVCLDLPDVDLCEWMLPAFLDQRFLSSASRWNPWDGRQGCSGFTVGNMKSLTLNVYDKLRSTLKQSEAYQLGMRQNRWGGCVPKSATRIEYQIRKMWMDQFQISQSKEVFQSLPAILHRLTEPEKRPFFVMTTSKIDRVNKHQSRAERHPDWMKVVGTFRTLIGTPTEPLRKIERGQLTCLKAGQMALGYLTSFAAQTGRLIETASDLLDTAKALFEINGFSDEMIHSKWLKKALAAGTLNEPQSFDFGQNSEGDRKCS